MKLFFVFLTKTSNYIACPNLIRNKSGWSNSGIPSVGSQFVADRNSVGFARKTALTISFVERGFERLGLDQ